MSQRPVEKSNGTLGPVEVVVVVQATLFILGLLQHKLKSSTKRLKLVSPRLRSRVAGIMWIRRGFAAFSIVRGMPNSNQAPMRYVSYTFQPHTAKLQALNCCQDTT